MQFAQEASEIRLIKYTYICIYIYLLKLYKNKYKMLKKYFKVFVVYPNAVVAHHTCIKNNTICPKTEKDFEKYCCEHTDMLLTKLFRKYVDMFNRL